MFYTRRLTLNECVCLQASIHLLSSRDPLLCDTRWVLKGDNKGDDTGRMKNGTNGHTVHKGGEGATVNISMLVRTEYKVAGD